MVPEQDDVLNRSSSRSVNASDCYSFLDFLTVLTKDGELNTDKLLSGSRPPHRSNRVGKALFSGGLPTD
jgi:hypothetical protein